MNIGIISDTHGYFDPRLSEALRGADQIIHAGDVGSQEVLDELSLIAPVTAVRGNVDSPEMHLPVTTMVQWEGAQIEILHILPVAQSLVERWSRRTALTGIKAAQRDRFLKSFHSLTRVIVFGHSHRPCLAALESRLYLNPGSAGKKRFSLPRCYAWMELSRGRAHVKILPLEDYNEEVIEYRELTFGG